MLLNYAAQCQAPASGEDNTVTTVVTLRDKPTVKTTGAVPQHESATSDGKRVSNHYQKKNTNRKKLP